MSKTAMMVAIVLGLGMSGLVAPVAAQTDRTRMGPAQRLLHDGARPSQRDLARSEVRRGSAMKTRSQSYDQIKAAQAAALWRSKKIAEAQGELKTSTGKKRKNKRGSKKQTVGVARNSGLKKK